MGKFDGKLRRPAPPPVDIGHAALGVFIQGRAGYGLLAAATTVGRPRGLGNTPALFGLFRRGPAIGVSQINALATNVSRG